ncbi:neprilysin-2-like [Oppia nitens]|uniref:neprilysin-2-like n=1 Tax=Oppia nitens TaxID=1686743 RepID=UPI0023DBBD16|nr:neprilysin-2-like [Oppia nitens]
MACMSVLCVIKHTTSPVSSRQQSSVRNYLTIFIYITTIGINSVELGHRLNGVTDDNDINNNNNNKTIVNRIDSSSDANNKVCLTRTCVQEAAKLLETLDESVNPCHDFYQFSCGQWIHNKQLPEHKSVVTRFNELSDELNNQLKGLIVDTNVETENRTFIINAKQYYDSCFNTSLLEDLGDKPLKDLIVELGGWPVISGPNWTDIQWTDVHMRLRDTGALTSMLFSLSISPDFQNNSRRILSIDHPSFGLGSRDVMLKGDSDKSVKAYKTLMTKTLLKLGVNQDMVDPYVEKLFAFEILLANNSMPKEERRNLTLIYNKITIKELIKLAPNIDWLRIVKKFVANNITADEDIVLFDTNYVKFLNEKLKQLDNRFLVDYILWRVVQTELSTLDESWYQLKQEFEFAIYGTKQRSPRWEVCLKNTKTALSIALSHLYVKHFFNDTNKQKAQEMFNNVVQEFKSSLLANTWMKSATLEHALKKLDNIKLVVGYPDELLDDKKVADYYQTLSMNSGDYFGNNARLTKWYSDLAFGKLRKPVDPFDWRELASVAIVNAYYHQLKNLVVMPAGILQGVFYNKDRPNYMNYGSIGYVSGHEIIHGFDDGGRQYDSSGNLRNWWDTHTDTVYKEKANCIIGQYGNYTVSEVNQKVNGINTQGENIADNGGVIQSYRAYQKYVAKSGVTEPRLPALDYTPNQLFWISSAVQWCSKSTNEYLLLQVLTDSHSPGRQRVNGVVSNSPEFAKVFNCPLGAPMNPVDKCAIW